MEGIGNSIRGHKVVSISSNIINDSSLVNLKEIDISFIYDIWNTERSILNKSPKDIIARDFELFEKIANQVFQLPEVQDLVKNEAFDLVIAEWIYPAMFGFSAVFNCPLIGISSIDLLDPLSTDIGNPVHPVVHPGFMLPFKVTSSFWERLESVKMSLWLQYLFNFHVYPASNKALEKYLKIESPDIRKIVNSISIVFVNSNFLFSKTRANTKNVIEFSGLHLKKSKPLPHDIQTFLDDATQGAIYFSLGSFIKSCKLSKELKNILLESFAELPYYKVLWKFEDENITIPSNNIKISKWLPQQDILAHKNVKAFITQGGMQSLEEAIRKRVPMIGIPFFVDQPGNIETMTNLGIAKYLDKSKITKEILKQAIIEVVENRSYHEKINTLAKLLEDEPIPSLDKVVWWIEYVIRHKGGPHLRSPFLETPWYQYFLLDILAFIICCVVASSVTLMWFLKITLRSVISTKQKNE